MSEKIKTAPPSIWAVLLGTGKRKLFWFFVLFCVLCVYGVKYYGQWEASQLETSYLELPAEELAPAGMMRIAFLADIHENRELFADAVEEIAAAKPDLIVFGGDLVMVGARMKRTRQLIAMFKDLAEIAPTYAILGNQDMERLPEVSRVLDEAGIRTLRNERLDWKTPSGSTLTIIGLGEWNEGDMKPELCMQAVDTEKHPVLLLSHDPESRHHLRNYDWDLMLAGHTHGGQLGNPMTGEYISFRSDMPAGLYYDEENPKKRIFVTRGIGSIMGMRFFCRPELNIIDILP